MVSESRRLRVERSSAVATLSADPPAPSAIDASLVIDIESAHDAMLEAQRRVEQPRFRRRRAVQALVDTRSAQFAALTRLGFQSYGQFVLWRIAQQP